MRFIIIEIICQLFNNIAYDRVTNHHIRLQEKADTILYAATLIMCMWTELFLLNAVKARC